MTIRCTHKFDYYQQIAQRIGSIICGLIASAMVFLINHTSIISIVICIAAFFPGKKLSYTGLGKLLTPLSTKLYLFFVCKTKVSYREARLVSFMFDGSLNGNWHPFDNLGVIPKEARKQFLFDFADKTYWNPGRTGSTKHTASKNADNTSQERTTVHEPLRSDKYYQSCRVMELQEGFTRDELKAKYKELMKKYHPDLFATGDAGVRHYAEEKAREINAAFEYLDNK
ncbi:hypothetical protein AGMMS49944_16720 [Spirochaetia bacterium]|nr:hypothetical protein AGMMS49944_16720 [Spirochaetia bacterium]